MSIRLPVIENRNYQYAFWRAMDRGCTRAVKSWHRRAGKDITDFQYLVREAVKRNGTYYYYFPTLEDAKGALWNNIVEFWHKGKIVHAGNMIDILCPKEIRLSKNESEHFIKVKSRNGGQSTIHLGGTDGLKVIGKNGFGYVFSEWQSQKKDAFDLISPILRENGGWALFNGTMRGQQNHLYQDIQTNMNNPTWFTQWLKPQDTKAYYWINETKGICVNPELEGRIHPDTLRPYDNIQSLVDSGETSFTMARQEYLNDAVAQVQGSYYAYELEELIESGRYKSLDPTKKPVYTFWDLGGANEENDSTAIVFAQMDGNTGKVDIIDYYENRGLVRGHYMDVLKKKGYVYAGHYMPHDSKRTNEWTGESTAETARKEHGVEVRSVPKAHRTSPEIETVRRDFVNYSINRDLCHQFYTKVSTYHEAEGSQKPCHRNTCKLCGGASHASDALRTLAMARNLKMITPYLRQATTVNIDIDPYLYLKMRDEKKEKGNENEWIIV